MNLDADLALLRAHMGDVMFEMMQRAIIVTIRIVAPERFDEGYAKVNHHLAETLRKPLN